MNLKGDKQKRPGIPAQWLLKGLSERGLGVEEVGRATGLTADQLATSDLVLSVENYNSLFEWAARQLDDPALGIHIAETANPKDFGLFTYLLENAGTLKEICLLYEHYHAIFTTEFAISFLHQEGDCHFIFHEARIPGSETREDIDFSLAAPIMIIRNKIDPNWEPKSCSFTYSPPISLAEHHRIFGKKLSFNQAHNWITFDDGFLEREANAADAELLNILRDQADHVLRQLDLSNDIAQSVRLLISSNLGRGALSAVYVAGELNMSVRKLHRKLSEKGTSFLEIRHDVLRIVAREALLYTDASVTEIAFKLGFSETSAFNRAFKKLEGTSPLQFRKSSKTG